MLATSRGARVGTRQALLDARTPTSSLTRLPVSRWTMEGTSQSEREEQSAPSQSVQVPRRVRSGDRPPGQKRREEDEASGVGRAVTGSGSRDAGGSLMRSEGRSGEEGSNRSAISIEKNEKRRPLVMEAARTKRRAVAASESCSRATDERSSLRHCNHI